MFLIPRSERVLDARQPNQLLLLSGMMAPEESYYPLVRFLRATHQEYSVAVLPLLFSLEDFDAIVHRAASHVFRELKSSPKRIVLFGHSHGGRVATKLAETLKERYPEAELYVITAGTPMVHRPDTLPLHYRLWFSLSKAYRTWPTVTHTESSVVQKQFGIYSVSDTVVTPECAKHGYPGTLVELSGLSHHDLIVPSAIGSHIQKVLSEIPS